MLMSTINQITAEKPTQQARIPAAMERKRVREKEMAVN